MPAPAGKPKSRKLTDEELSALILRWGMLAVGLTMMLTSLILRVQPSLLSKGTSLIADMFGKVGLVFLAAWLAWPAVIALRKAPGGMLVLVGAMATMLLFVYRPRTIYLTGPFIGIAAGLAIIVGWIRKNSLPPQKRPKP